MAAGVGEGDEESVGVGEGEGVVVGEGEGLEDGVEVGVGFSIGSVEPESWAAESKYIVNLYPCFVAPAPAKKMIA